MKNNPEKVERLRDHTPGECRNFNGSYTAQHRVPAPPLHPPRPGRPSERGRASFTLRVFPLRSLPLSALIAACASASEDISTNPKPFDLPLCLSFITVAVSTFPNGSKASRKSSSVTSYERVPT